MPQLGQKWRDIWFPLSARLVKQPIAPVTSIAELGKIAFAVPLPEIFWQTRHQQIRETKGSPLIVYWTVPQRQLPVRSVMLFSGCCLLTKLRHCRLCGVTFELTGGPRRRSPS